MKKLLKGLMTLIMAATLVACGGNETSIDLGEYPENFNDWTTQNVIDYMFEKGVFTNEEFAYVQTKTDEFNPSPDSMTELGSYMSDDGMIGVMIFFWDDATETELIKTEYEYAKTNKEANIIYTAYDESMPMPCTHMLGQFGFYDMSADPEFTEKFEAAIQDLAKDVNTEFEY